MARSKASPVTRRCTPTLLPVWCERNEPRQLAVDQEIAVPVNKVVHLLVTSNDVIHSWTIPSFGVKMQAVPGRTAAVWFQADTGQACSTGSARCCAARTALGHADRRSRREAPVYDAWMAALKAKDKKKASGNPEGRRRANSPRRTWRSEVQTENSGEPAVPAFAPRLRRQKTTSETRANSHMGSTAHAAARRPRSRAAVLQALVLFDEPQGHRHDVPAVRDLRRAHRRLPLGDDAYRAASSPACSISPTKAPTTCS